MSEYQYPKDLIDYLTEQEADGCEIFTTQSSDGAVWMVVPRGLDKWVVYIEWFQGENTYSMVNVCEKAFDRLKKVMAECEELDNE